MMSAVCVLCWSCSVCVVTAIQRDDMFPYGTLSGDLILAEGDDETSKVLSLPKPLYFYDTHFSQLYVSIAAVCRTSQVMFADEWSADFMFEWETSGNRNGIGFRVICFVELFCLRTISTGLQILCASSQTLPVEGRKFADADY